MIETPDIVHTDTVMAAVIRIIVPHAEIQTVMGPAIAEVMAAVTAQRIGPAGSVFAHHLRMEHGTFDFEVGVPVKGPVTPVGRVRAGELAAAKAARTVYHGPYDGLFEAWKAFDAWVRAEGQAPAPDLIERYIIGPETSANPADWRTELNRPLV